MAKSQSFKPGERILEEEPWIHVLKSEEVERRCYHCLQLLSSNHLATITPAAPKTGTRCSGCHFVRYCSTECQNRCWEQRHKVECAGLQRMLEAGVFKPDETFLLALQTVAQLTKIQKGNIPAAQQTFIDLTGNTHASHHYIPMEVLQMRNRIMLYLALNKKQKDQIPPERFLDIVAKLQRYSVAIDGADLQPIATGIYLQAASVKHSCAPNASRTFTGKRLNITALKEIGSIQKVCISYVDNMLPMSVRRNQLKMLHCQCPTCSNPKKDAERFSLRCLDPKCNGEIPSDERAELACSKCNVEMIRKTFKESRQQELLTVSMSVHRLGANRDFTQGELVSLEKHLTDVLPASSPLWPVFYFNKGLFLRGGKDQSWRRCFEKALKLYRAWVPPVDPRIGWCAYYAADTTASDQLAAAKKMEEAHRVLGMMYGPENEAVQEAGRFLDEYPAKVDAKSGNKRMRS